MGPVEFPDEAELSSRLRSTRLEGIESGDAKSPEREAVAEMRRTCSSRALGLERWTKKEGGIGKDPTPAAAVGAEPNVAAGGERTDEGHTKAGEEKVRSLRAGEEAGGIDDGVCREREAAPRCATEEDSLQDPAEEGPEADRGDGRGSSALSAARVKFAGVRLEKAARRYLDPFASLGAPARAREDLSPSAPSLMRFPRPVPRMVGLVHRRDRSGSTKGSRLLVLSDSV